MSETNVIPLPLPRTRGPAEEWFSRSRRKDPAAYRPQPDRGDDPDFWPTIDPDLIGMLVSHVLPVLPSSLIWEAGAGAGHLVDPLRQAGRQVFASDLFPGRGDIERHDFVHRPLPPQVVGAVMLTNPPNSRLTEFVIRGLTLIDAGQLAGLVLLTRLGADTTDGRGPAFNRAAYEWRTCWRPWWKPRTPDSKSPRWTAQWTVWLAGCSGPPVSWRVRRCEARAVQLDLFENGIPVIGSAPR